MVALDSSAPDYPSRTDSAQVSLFEYRVSTRREPGYQRRLRSEARAEERAAIPLAGRSSQAVPKQLAASVAFASPEARRLRRYALLVRPALRRLGLTRFDPLSDIFHRPQRSRDASRHRGRDLERLMDADEVVEHEVESQRVDVV